MQASSDRCLAIVLVVALGACDHPQSSASVDSLLQRDLALAATSHSTPPTFSDTAVSEPTPVAPTRAVARNKKPAPAPRPRPVAPPAPTETVAVASVPVAVAEAPRPLPGRSRSIGAGSVLIGHTGTELCSLANRPGDRLVATLSYDVATSDGTYLPAGTPILVQLASPGAGGAFAFLVKAVQVDGELIPIEGRVHVEGSTTERKISKGGDKGKVVGGAIAGAILGRVLGGGAKGTIIGAAGGAAAGTVAASRNTVTETCLAAGATLTVTLSAPLVLIPGVP